MPQSRVRAPLQRTPYILYLHLGTVSRNQILQLLGHTGLRRIFASHGGAWLGLGGDAAEDEDDDDFTARGHGTMLGWGRRRRRAANSVEFPKVPSDVGRELMDSGTFGSNEYYKISLRKRKRKLARRVMSRELGNCTAQGKRANNLLLQVWVTDTLSLPY